MRESLVESGVLAIKKDRYVFTRDFEFGSPSAAGGAVRGGNTNGLKSWKTKGGKTIKEIEQNF